MELETIDEKTFEPPETRIATSSQARSIVSTLRQADLTRAIRRTKIQGLLDGNPPWSGARLRSKGQGERTNLNLREGEGQVEAAKTPYYDLVFEVPLFANIRCRYPETETNLNAEWSEVISEEYHAMLSEWRGFDFNVQLHQWEMCVFGVGPVYWPDAVDWRFEALKISNMLVPDKTKADIDRLPLCVILHDFSTDELYRLACKNETAAKAAGWSVKLARKLIREAKHDTVNDTGNQSWETFQEQMRSGDLYQGISRSKIIKVATILYKEYDGKISHVIVPDDGTPVTAHDSYGTLLKEEENFLYKKIARFDGFENVIMPFFFDIGTGNWHSIKGMGPKIYDFCEVSNRLTCKMIDGANIGSGLILKAPSGTALQETQLAHITGAVVIQPGYEVQQSRLQESLQGPMIVKRELQGVLQSNTGQYRQRVTGENHEPTLGQAEMNQATNAMLTKGAINRYYKIFDNVHREMLRRAFNPKLRESHPGGKEAFAFRERCVDRGVPEEVLNFEHIRSVKTSRALGAGSPAMQEMATRGLMELLPMMDEQSRNNALRARAARLVGQEMVNSYFPRISESGNTADHAALATLENNALRTGGSAMVTPRQNHATHFAVHFQDAQGHMQEMQMGANPVEVLAHMDAAGPHLIEHLDALTRDPTRKQQIAQMGQAFQMLSKATDQLRQNVEEAAAAEAASQPPPEQQMDPEFMAKMAEVSGNLAIKKQKAEGDFQVKLAKYQHTARLADLKTADDIRRKNAETAAEEPTLTPSPMV